MVHRLHASHFAIRLVKTKFQAEFNAPFQNGHRAFDIESILVQASPIRESTSFTLCKINLSICLKNSQPKNNNKTYLQQNYFGCCSQIDSHIELFSQEIQLSIFWFKAIFVMILYF